MGCKPVTSEGFEGLGVPSRRLVPAYTWVRSSVAERLQLEMRFKTTSASAPAHQTANGTVNPAFHTRPRTAKGNFVITQATAGPLLMSETAYAMQGRTKASTQSHPSGISIPSVSLAQPR